MRRIRPALATARPLQFGIAVVAEPADPRAAAEVARWAEDVGLDWLGVRDRPGVPRFLDTWTLLATLVPATHRIGLYPDVAGSPLPQPVVLAEAAATLTRLSAGRVAVGVGAGWLWDAVHAYGGPHLSPWECADVFERALRCMHAVWDRGVLDGRRPPELWCGTQGVRMLRVTGRLADGWSASAETGGGDGGLGDGRRLVDDAARRAARAGNPTPSAACSPFPSARPAARAAWRWPDGSSAGASASASTRSCWVRCAPATCRRAGGPRRSSLPCASGARRPLRGRRRRPAPRA